MCSPTDIDLESIITQASADAPSVTQNLVVKDPRFPFCPVGQAGPRS